MSDLHDEIARLQEDNIRLRHSMRDVIAERERFRATLRKIAESGEADEAVRWMVDLAEKALLNE